MKIADQVAHRALAYVAAVRRHGYKLSEPEFTEYIQYPLQKMRSGFGLADWSRLMNILEKPAETTLEWLGRVKWLSVENGIVDLSELGRAVLASLDEEELELEGALEITLGTEDPFSYARVIGRIAQRGDALLVDPYFKLDHLLDILVRTTVRGVLISRKTGKGQLAGLETAISNNSLEREFEIRVEEEFHDRYVIPRSGDVDMIGASLNGVGKKPTVMVTIKSPAADQIRRTYQELWDRASPIAAATAEEARPHKVTGSTQPRAAP